MFQRFGKRGAGMAESITHAQIQHRKTWWVQEHAAGQADQAAQLAAARTT